MAFNSTQLEEKSAMESILGEDLIILKENDITSELEFLIKIEVENLEHTTQHFPSVVPPLLYFKSNKEYPEKAPEFELICPWLMLKEKGILTQKLEQAWVESKSEVLFTYYQILKTEILECLCSPIEIKEVSKKELQLYHKFNILKNIDSCNTETLIMEYDISIKSTNFISNNFQCDICITRKKGKECIQFYNCFHVYCRLCIKGYFGMLIREGMVFDVCCPHSNCRKPKSKSRLEYKEPQFKYKNSLQDIVGPEKYVRFKKLKKKYLTEMDPRVVYCPLSYCQTAIIKNNQEEKLCICSKCNYAFCFYCKKIWHGYAQKCTFNDSHKLAEKYLNACSLNLESEKNIMELRYGKENLNRFTKKLVEEKRFKKWKQENTQDCPTCFSSIEKSFGCNHMICSMCNTHFCYICGSYVDGNNPYSHFNNAGSNCHMKLFEGVNTQDFDIFDIQ